MTHSVTTSRAVEEAADPLPVGRIAMWLFIAADLMFFVGLMGAFIVLRAGNAGLFADHVRGLSKGLGGAGVAMLIVSSVAMFFAARAARNGWRRGYRLALTVTLVLACAFLGSRCCEYFLALNHHTIVAILSERHTLMLFDGQIEHANGQTMITGYAAPLPEDFDPHIISEYGVARISGQKAGNVKQFVVPPEIFEDVRYGPGKNIFYAAWFTLTGAHLVHLVIGTIAVAVLLVRSFGGKFLPASAAYVGMYWQLMVLVNLVMFLLIYLR